MTSKKVKSHPDMERALNPEEKTVTVPKEIQFFTDYEGPPLQQPSSKLFGKTRYLPRQFKNLPSYFQLEPAGVPRSSMEEGGNRSYFSVQHHELLNPMTPEDLLKNYYGDEEFPLGDEDDPPLLACEKPWEAAGVTSLGARKPDQCGDMVKYQADEPAPPAYQASTAGRPKSKKVNRSGSGKKKSAKAKKKAAKARKLAKATKSSASANFNNENAITTVAEEPPPSASSANECRELVPMPPPPPYEELEPLTDILIKIRIYKPFDDDVNGTNIQYQNVVAENHDVLDMQETSLCSEEYNSMNKINKGILITKNREMSGPKKTSADNDADSFNKWYYASRLADSGKNDAYAGWPDNFDCPEHFKLFPGSIMETCYPAHLRFSYEYIQFDPKSIETPCGHEPGDMESECESCSEEILSNDEGDKTRQYNRRQYKGGEGEVRSY